MNNALKIDSFIRLMEGIMNGQFSKTASTRATATATNS